MQRPGTNTTAAVLAAATAALRLPRAFGASFWQDEVASARILREPTFPGMLRHVVRTESTPPLWYALGWIVHRAGLSIHDVRLLSVAFDALLVALVVVLAARLLPLSLAAAAGVLVAVGGQLSFDGREIRAYALLALLVVVFAYALHAAALAPSRGRLAALAAVTAAGAMTHYFFAFTLAAGVAWLWVEPTARDARLRATGAVAAGLVACTPWLSWFLAQFRHDRFSWIGPFDGREVIETPLRLLAPGITTPFTGALALLWLLVAAAGARRRGPLPRLLALLALAPLAAAAVVWLAGMDVYAVRNLVGIGPFAAVLATMPAAGLRERRRAALAAAVGAAAIGLFAWGQRVPPTPFREVAHALVAEGWRPSDPVVVGNFFAFRSPLEWYLPRSPRFVREPLARVRRSPVYAVLRHARPRGPWVRARRVGPFLVAVLRSTRALRHGVVLAVPPSAAERPVEAGVHLRTPVAAAVRVREARHRQPERA